MMIDWTSLRDKMIKTKMETCYNDGEMIFIQNTMFIRVFFGIFL